MRAIAILLLSAFLCGAQSAPKGPTGTTFDAEVVQVFPDGLLVEKLRTRYVSSGPGGNGSGGGTSTRSFTSRTGQFAFLVPGTKCALGDRFYVEARESGTKLVDVEGKGEQPVRRYVVTKARRHGS